MRKPLLWEVAKTDKVEPIAAAMEDADHEALAIITDPKLRSEHFHGVAAISPRNVGAIFARQDAVYALSSEAGGFYRWSAQEQSWLKFTDIPADKKAQITEADVRLMTNDVFLPVLTCYQDALTLFAEKGIPVPPYMTWDASTILQKHRATQIDESKIVWDEKKLLSGTGKRYFVSEGTAVFDVEHLEGFSELTLDIAGQVFAAMQSNEESAQISVKFNQVPCENLDPSHTLF